MTEEAYLQFFENMPYYIILLGICVLTIYGLFFNKPGTYKYTPGGPRIKIGTNDDGTPKHSSDDKLIIGEKIGGKVISIKTNIQLFYLFILSINLLIISLFKYFFEGMRWLVYALFQKEKETAIQGNINKDIFNQEIKNHAQAIYSIIYIFICY